MSRRGPLPELRGAKAARGSWRGQVPKGEPQVEVAAPASPHWLNEGAKQEWKRLVPILLARQTLSIGDRDILAMLCLHLSELAHAETLIEQLGGSIVEQTSDEAMRLRKVRDCAADRIRRTLEHFGLSPASLQRVREYGKEEKPQDKASKFIRL